MTGLPHLFLFLLFWLLPPPTAKRLQTVCVLRNYFKSLNSYYKPGDLIIGGNLPLGTMLLPTLGVGFEFSQGEGRVYPSFFRINPKESPQYVGLVQLLLYFQWNWVGLVAPEDDNGECFISSLTPMLKEKEICLAFTERLKLDFFAATIWKVLHSSKIWSEAEVIILFGDSASIIKVVMTMKIHEEWTKTSFCKVWILTSHWKVSMGESQDIVKGLKFFHGSLHFRDHTRDVSEFTHFILSLDSFNPHGDMQLTVNPAQKTNIPTRTRTNVLPRSSTSLPIKTPWDTL
ncbi:hypothetical protein E2320_022157 [Naja naja]|nr:hypothetical protein E2320_022157 [Naja naja]